MSEAELMGTLAWLCVLALAAFVRCILFAVIVARFRMVILLVFRNGAATSTIYVLDLTSSANANGTWNSLTVGLSSGRASMASALV
jgi:hypothetical protein